MENETGIFLLLPTRVPFPVSFLASLPTPSLTAVPYVSIDPHGAPV